MSIFFLFAIVDEGKKNVSVIQILPFANQFLEFEKITTSLNTKKKHNR